MLKQRRGASSASCKGSFVASGRSLELVRGDAETVENEAVSSEVVNIPTKTASHELVQLICTPWTRLNRSGSP